ncbi:hypothetical protein IAR55_005830 [Kwoniella newhampshirensis]|uniref:Armadillo repeat-containing protein 8 n=1 Tax=Kwoniella newhampshirensis TaxID=1651941 RepID=A0AAW0YVI8_9TREE
MMYLVSPSQKNPLSNVISRDLNLDLAPYSSLPVIARRVPTARPHSTRYIVDGSEMMTSSSATYTTLVGASTSTDLLAELKDLKNSVIGNTWKKVEVVEDEQLLLFLLSLLRVPSPGVEDSDVSMELMSETAVIVGALANIGDLTLRPLLVANTPSHLLGLISALTLSTSLSDRYVHRLLPQLLRALRNLLVSTADMVWGHMWGVGAERKVVGTGLVGMDIMSEADARKGKEVPGRNKAWKVEAIRSLGLVFEPTNLTALLSILQTHPDTKNLLPLYQLFSRLVALPSHRQALASWRPSSDETHRIDRHEAGPSALKLSDIHPSAPSSIQRGTDIPFIIYHLLSTIISINPETGSSYGPGNQRQSPKLVEAALDLLAALIKGQPSVAAAVRSWSSLSNSAWGEGGIGDDVEFGEGEGDVLITREFISRLVSMLLLCPTGVRIAAASCLTNIVKAHKGSRPSDRIRSVIINFQLIDEIGRLLKTEGWEERVKLCFILAALVSDDASLQKMAADKGCPAQLTTILLSIGQDEGKGELGNDLASRSREATLLALASLAMQYEPTRSAISDSNPPVLPHILSALSHPSYGVRAAACQLARALSRTVAILRTSLVDSGVGEEVIRVLKREVDGRANRDIEEGRGDVDGDGELGERIWTVEVAASATICNLIADFSPLKTTLLLEGGLELLCELTRSTHEPLALNALWALKNLTFHAMESTKLQVTLTLGWDRLRALMTLSTPLTLRVQAFEITQNLLAEATALEISRTVENLGEKELLDLVTNAAKEGEQVELRIPALYVLSNLALGNERLRACIVGRVEILEVLSGALNSKLDPLKVPSLRTLRHLIESNAKTHKPRQGMVDLFQPYQLKPRLKELAEASASLDVCQAAVGLLNVLDRGRDGGGVSSGGR